MVGGISERRPVSCRVAGVRLAAALAALEAGEGSAETAADVLHVRVSAADTLVRRTTSFWHKQGHNHHIPRPHHRRGDRQSRRPWARPGAVGEKISHRIHHREKQNSLIEMESRQPEMG
jgi:hypothetical protein